MSNKASVAGKLRSELTANLCNNDELTAPQWALNSAVECHPHTVEVIGSNPIAPTISRFGLVPFRPASQLTVYPPTVQPLSSATKYRGDYSWAATSVEHRNYSKWLFVRGVGDQVIAQSKKT
jgi:hypothetical protein